MPKQRLYNYLINIRDFLKYGFRDTEVCILGVSKLEKEQGKNDGDLCVLAYDLPKNDCILAGSCYGVVHSEKTNSLEKSNYNLVKKKEV